MKKVIFISIAVFSTTAIFLFRHGRSKKHHQPIMKFNDLYRDNNIVQKLNGGGKYGADNW